MSSIRAQYGAAIARSPQDVWDFVVDPANERLWHTDVVEGEILSQPPLAVGSRVRWVMNFGGRRPVTLRVERFEPLRVQELRAENAVMGVAPTLVYELVPDGGGTRFTRTIEMNTEGPARLMTPLMRRNVVKGNEQFVGNLKRTLEAGPPAV